MRNQTECQAKYDKKDFFFNSDSMICTGSSEKSVGACRGDIGGPVIDIIANGDGTISKELIGITSHNVGCGDKEFGSIVSRLSSEKIDWILESAVKMHCKIFPKDMVCLRPTDSDCELGMIKVNETCSDIDECSLTVTGFEII